jgi:hypothetical protein
MPKQKGMQLKSGKKLCLVWISEEAYTKAKSLKNKTLKEFCDSAILHYATIKEKERDMASEKITEKEKL